MEDSIGTLFFRDKQARMFLALINEAKEWHLADLAKETDVTYIHTSRFVSKCEENGLITTEKHGRIKQLKLTEKGKSVANMLTNIMKELRQPEAATPSQ